MADRFELCKKAFDKVSEDPDKGLLVLNYLLPGDLVSGLNLAESGVVHPVLESTHQEAYLVDGQLVDVSCYICTCQLFVKHFYDDGMKTMCEHLVAAKVVSLGLVDPGSSRSVKDLSHIIPRS
uniref:ARAD1B00770p n=1 Tax=Blastobotrys adeninivorans TaxID=409370 RepID=A0A060T519_BLAAD